MIRDTKKSPKEILNQTCVLSKRKNCKHSDFFMQSCPEFNSDDFLFLMSLMRLLEAEIHHDAQIYITPHNQIQVMIENIRNEEEKDEIPK